MEVGSHLNRKDFTVFLSLEIVTLVGVIAAFRVIPVRPVAGVLAGLFFILLGFFILIKSLRRESYRGSLTFWVNLVHLFGTSLPIMVVYLWTLPDGFRTVYLFGVSGTEFHWFSEQVYVGLMGATLIDLVRSFFRSFLKSSC